MAAQHITKRLVHQVRDGVMAHIAIADMPINFSRYRIANGQFARGQGAVMAENVGLNFLRVLHLE